MNEHIKVFPENSPQYKRLQNVLAVLQETYPDDTFTIQTVYFDAGQNWKWTTILAYSKRLDMYYQLFTPKNQKEVLDLSTDLPRYVRKLNI